MVKETIANGDETLVLPILGQQSTVALIETLANKEETKETAVTKLGEKPTTASFEVKMKDYFKTVMDATETETPELELP